MNSQNTFDSTDRGVIIINTGTPAELSRSAIRRFIADMLSDPHLLGMPSWVRIPLARGIIAPVRAGRSFVKYSLIWGRSPYSPLMLHSRQLAQMVEQTTALPTALAMRYGAPSVELAIETLKQRVPNLRQIILLPLMPHFAKSSYLTAVEYVRNSASIQSGSYDLQIIRPYYDSTDHIEALAESITSSLADDPRQHHVVFSFHSLPAKHSSQGRALGRDFDYEYQCGQTVKLVSERLGLAKEQYSIAFASAMSNRWLGPKLEHVIIDLIAKGVKNVAVAAPGFIIDNLETLYDIDVDIRKTFLTNGGESFIYIPCLNSDFVKPATALITRQASDSTQRHHHCLTNNI